jgi:hypothetical protein
MTTLSKGQQVAADVSALFRARNPLLWIVTKEEARIEGFVAQAAAAAGYPCRVWDVAQGVAGIDGRKEQIGGADIDTTLAAIRARAEAGSDRGVWILRDLPVWISGPGGATTLRILRNLARLLPGVPRERAQAIVILTPSSEVPAELSGHATVIEWPLPDRSEIAATLDAAIAALPETDEKTGALVRALAAPGDVRERGIDAAVGLSAEEAASCFARSLVTTKRIDPDLITREKRRVIARLGGIEWYDPLPGGIEAVGGLENLKAWLVARRDAYTQEARDYGLPAPKGTFFCGVSGCGKSFMAKAIATTWGIPLLRIDLGALRNKFVGSSENNLREAFKIIGAIGRCIVWFDEIEKSLQGATSGSADGGVSADALGAILTWMQERQGLAFVIATANSVDDLPPELLRKGRFDEFWFVDLPTPSEREAVLASALKALGRTEAIDLTAVARVCKDFTGAEIAAIVPDALYAAFGDGARELRTTDLIQAAKSVTPLAETAKEKITKLREWAKGKARPASRTAVDAEAPQAAVRTLDL